MGSVQHIPFGNGNKWNFTDLAQLYLAAGESTVNIGPLQIVRLAPTDGKVVVDWQYSGNDTNFDLSAVELEWKERGESSGQVITGSHAIEQSAALPGGVQGRFEVNGLVNFKDYECRVKAKLSEAVMTSLSRLFKPCAVPGTVVNYIHPEDYVYGFSGRSPASPAILELPGGALLASHDVFWGKAGQNLTILLRSDDQGQSWYFLNYLAPCFWGKLFLHRDRLYMLATSTEYGALLIGASDDAGIQWSKPVELLPAGSREAGGPHKAPMPVIEHEGRLWTAIDFGSWGLGGHSSGLISAAADSDLLYAASWVTTPFLAYDPAWPGAIEGGKTPSLLEGNAVVTREGRLINFLRYQTIGGSPEYGRAMYLEADASKPDAPLVFGRTVKFYGNMSKFSIARDESGVYWSLVNPVTTDNVKQRNVLSLVSSSDLHEWKLHANVLNYEDNDWPEDSQLVGFQYVDWLFKGKDIYYLSRTAIGGAHNYHNANYITFHTIKDYASLT